MSNKSNSKFYDRMLQNNNTSNLSNSSNVSKFQNNKNTVRNDGKFTKLNKTDIHQHTNKFINKINEIYHLVIIEKTEINKIMCETLLSHITKANECDFFTNNSTNSFLIIDIIKQKLFELCCTDMPNTTEHNLLVLNINKICGWTKYNKNIIDEINNKFESLIMFLNIDPQIISKIKTTDTNFYIKLLNFINAKDVIKVFKNLNCDQKSFAVCKTALKLDYNCIKYIDKIDSMEYDQLCDIAICLGHTNLSDIPISNRTEDICLKYIDLNRENIKHVTYNKLLRNTFFIDLVKKDITNLELIKDPLCFDPSLCTYVVKKNGLLIKHIPPKCQSLRLIELAVKQNKLSKYYVTYDCFENSNRTEILNLITELHKSPTSLFALINKNEHNSIDLQIVDFSNKCLFDVNKHLSLDTGILFEKKNNIFNMYVMTGENYLNHQYRQYYDNGYTPNIDVFELQHLSVLKKNTMNKDMLELASLIVDSNSNTYVVFFEINQ